MKTLLVKEIRLLAPAYGAALLLATVPVWLFPKTPGSTIPEPAFYTFCLGAVMLALSSFGREFSLKTFSLILAQPLERGRIWWTKVGLLGAAMGTVLAAWCLCCAACSYEVFSVPGGKPSIWREALTYGGTTAVVAFVGGLWTTLLLRQVAAAFWFTLLIPLGILAALAPKAQTEPLILPALGLYSLGAFWWAWRYFLRVEEVGWTGGEIAFPGRRTAAVPFHSTRRGYRPLAAIMRKELQLHLVGLAGMAGLFMLHLAVVGVRKAGENTFGEAVRSALELFGGIWFLVPLLIGGPSVAEERKLGTLQEQLCVPVSRRVQFLLKLGMVLGIGGLLSAVLVWTAEGISYTVGLHSSVDSPFQGEDLAGMACLFLALSLSSFYASTLARNLVQAMAVAVVTATGVIIFAAVVGISLQYVWPWLWRGELIYYVGWPMVVVTFLWLAWRNFRSGAELEQLWWRNLLGLVMVLVMICGVTAAVFHRVWEWVPPREPAHGPARLAVTQPVQIQSDGNDVAILAPDGRLWVERFGHKQGRPVLAFQRASMPGWVERGIRVGGSLVKLSRNPGVAGTNWTDAVASSREVVAIRADGTLWVSERPRVPGTVPPMESAAALVQVGQATDWKSVVQEYYPWSVALLKQDGTLWRWGTNNFSDRLEWPGLRAFEPQRLTSQTGWTRVLQGIGCLYAWKGDGSAWAIHAPDKAGQPTGLEWGAVVERVPSFDHIQWRSLTQFMGGRVGLRADGSLWAWNVRRSRNGMGESYEPIQMKRIGSATDWVAVAGNWRDLAALKSDGSLWKWDNSDNWGREMQLLAKPPRRLSTHSDWVGLGLGSWGIVSLATDGSLWSWYSPVSYEQRMLAPSRKPVRLDNVLGPQM